MLGPDLRLDVGADRGVVAQEALRRFAALAEARLAVGEPRAGLRHDVHRHADVEEPALAADPLAVHDVELGDPERRRDLVLDDLDADAVADRLRAGLDRLDPADVEPHRGVELQGPATGRDLRVPEHDPDLLAELVREHERGVGAADRARQLAQRLAHEARLDADEAVPHLAFDLGPRDERGDGVDDDDVDPARADEGLGDLEGLLPGVRLADEELIDVDPAGARVARVQGVLHVDEGGDAAAPLGLGDDVLAERGLAGRLRAEHLGDPPARNASDAEREVEGDRSGRDEVDLLPFGRAELHDRPAAELLLDGEDRRLDRLRALRGRCPVPLRHRHLVLLLSGSVGPDGTDDDAPARVLSPPALPRRRCAACASA